MKNYLLKVDIGLNTTVNVVIKADSQRAAQDEIKNIPVEKLIKLWHQQQRPGFQAKLVKNLGSEVKVEFWNTPEQAVKTGETGTVKISGVLNKHVFTILNDVFENYRVSPGIDGGFSIIMFENTEIFYWEIT